MADADWVDPERSDDCGGGAIGSLDEERSGAVDLESGGGGGGAAMSLDDFSAEPRGFEAGGGGVGFCLDDFFTDFVDFFDFPPVFSFFAAGDLANFLPPFDFFELRFSLRFLAQHEKNPLFFGFFLLAG